MKKLLFFAIVLLSYGSLKSQDYRVVHFDDIDSAISVTNDSMYLLNFWATWCKPCVEELPYIDNLTSKYKGKKFKVILISLDLQSQIESKFKPFLIKHNLQSEVWYLDEKKFNKFIPNIDGDWSGALPFTLIFRTKDKLRISKEGVFNEKELMDLISTNL